MPVSIYEAVWIFLIYAFLGWCTEVAYAALETKNFINRGFLNGPVCPVYGFGVLVVILALTPLKKNFLLLFAGSFMMTSMIEFITGFLLEKLFHNQWWDYSEENFNLCGYVCLKFSILWGLGCTLVIDVVHPAIYKMIVVTPKLPGAVVLTVLCVIFAVDTAITVASILSLNKRIELLNEIAVKLKSVSNEIGGNIYEGITIAVEKGGEWKENADVRAAEISEKRESFKENMKSAVSEERTKLLEEYHRLMKRSSFGSKRLMKAFPRMKSTLYQETFQKWKSQNSNNSKDAKCHEQESKKVQ
ncbi:putative ABC transporter permease [Lachnospiraceae bacterium 45-W7]